MAVFSDTGAPATDDDPAIAGDASPEQASVRDASFVALLERVAARESGAETDSEAVIAAVEELCAWTGWPVGHLYWPDERGRLRPSEDWVCPDELRYQAFRTATAEIALAPGAGLPGRVAATGHPAWITDLTADEDSPRAAAARCRSRSPSGRWRATATRS